MTTSSSLAGFRRGHKTILAAFSVCIILPHLPLAAQTASYSYENTTSGNFDDRGGSAQDPLVRAFDVTDDFLINDLNVGLNLRHTWRGDVSVDLTSPSGTTVNIVSIPSWDSNDHLNVLIDGDSTNPFDDNLNDYTGSPYYDRTVGPSNSLDAFNGESAIGTWTMELYDLQVGASSERVGTFGRARLDFQGVDAGATFVEVENTTTGTFDHKGGSSQNPLVRTFTVANAVVIDDLNVGLNLEHTWRGDVRVRLISPSGTAVNIVSLPSNDSNDHFDVILDSASGNPLDDGTNNNTSSPYYERTAASSNSLNAFNGELAQGTWTMEITDLQIGASSDRVGTFNRAKLIIEASPSLDAYCDSEIFDYAALATGTEFNMSNQNATIDGDLGLGAGVAINAGDGAVTGAANLDTSLSGNLNSLDDTPGAGGNAVNEQRVNMATAVSDAQAFAAIVESMTPTQSFGTIKDPTTITASAPDGNNVIAIDEIDLKDSEVLNLHGSPTDFFYINVASKAKFENSAAMLLTGGLDPSHIVMNLLPGGTELKMAGGNAYGTFIAVDTGAKVKVERDGVVYGTVIGDDLTVKGNGRVDGSSAYRFECLLPVISIADVSVVEAAGAATLTIRVDQAVSSDITIGYATANDSALAGSDYTAMTGSATIAAGAVATRFTVPILDDATDESTESFVVNLANPGGISLAVGQARVTINDDDGSVGSTSRIGDLLWDDVDQDGVRDGNEAGIPGVTVQLFNGATPIASTTTDSIGRYAFNGFAAGTYTLRVVETGTLAGSVRTYDEDGGTGAPNGETVLSLASNQSYLSADFGYQLPAGFGSLKGVVAQEYFVPLPEAHVQRALKELDANSGRVGNQIESVVSIVATTSGTILCYDHWEDGYETDVANPAQSSTEIWGDNDPSNGIPPGFVTDMIGAKDVVALENAVGLPRNASSLRYDGRDKIVVTNTVAVTRAAWGTKPGEVLAGAVEVMAVDEWGTRYEVPVGEDLNSDEVFEYVALHIIAAENGTSVSIDSDGDGSVDVSTALNQGEAYQINGGVRTGATVAANQKVQAHLITGDVRPSGYYETRWYTLYPVEDWTSDYYSPVGSTSDTDTNIFLYNPNGSGLTVNYTTSAGSGSVSVGARDTERFTMPRGTGAHFTAVSREPFFAIAAVADSGRVDNDIYDWGFSLVPNGNLTAEAVVGWGPGSGGNANRNGNPIWVTAVSDTTLYVDYDGDPITGSKTDANGDRYDDDINIDALESVKVFDNTDNDQTGMRLYTLNNTLITAAWGQDPDTANPGNPFLDMGTTILPFPIASVDKQAALFVDNNFNGEANWGDTLEYTITVVNRGSVPVTNITVTDTPPAELTYVPNSTTLDGAPVSDNLVGTPFPLDGTGFVVLDLAPGESRTIVYTAGINVGASGVVNNVSVSTDAGTFVATSEVPVPPSDNITSSTLELTDAGGTPVDVYVEDDTIYVSVTDGDQNVSGLSVETIDVVVSNASGDDVETVVLTETGANTGVFFGNVPSSASTGLANQDGTLYITGSQVVLAQYVDPVYGDSASDSLIMGLNVATKILYLTDPGEEMDRIDPVANGDSTTASFSFGTGNVGSGNVSLTAIEDTYLNEIASTTNYGSNTTMLVDASGGGLGEGRLVVRFDLSAIPSGATIDSASLTLTKTAGDSGGKDMEVHEVTTAWSEGLATWRSPWGTDGGDYDATVLDTLVITSNQSYTWSSASLTALIQAWVNGSKTNHGFLLASPNTGHDEYFFATSEAGSGQPLLEISYSGGSGSSSGSVSDGFDSVSYSGGSGWTGAWTEMGESDGPSAGRVEVKPVSGYTGNAIEIGGWRASLTGRGLTREVDLSGASSATLTFNHSRSGGEFSYVRLKISRDGGASWTTLKWYSMEWPTPYTKTAQTFDITAYASANTQIRFEGWGSTYGTGYLYIDDVSIDYTGASGGGGSSSVASEGFDSVSFSGGTGWSGSWTEIYESNGPSSGNVYVSNNELRMKYYGRGIQRTVDLSAVSSATLSLKTTIFGNGNDYYVLEASTNGGSTWRTLDTYASQTSNGSVQLHEESKSYVLGDYISLGSSTILRFRITSGFGDGSQYAGVDDIVINTVGSGGSGGGEAAVTFVQAPAMAKDFVVLGSGLINAPMFVDVTGGSLGANPDIGAGIYLGGDLLLSMGNPTVTSLGGTLYRLDWSGVAGSDEVVAAGKSFRLKIENNEPTLSFDLLYDSASAPSRIELPTETIINIDALEFYDAPYPGGNQITSAGAGQTVYVRITVSDPFGAYDITSVDVSIPPLVNTNLDDTYVVETTDATKTYEYGWVTGASEAAYPVSLTAYEGTEGIVHTFASEFVVTSQDTGTESFASFTDPGGMPLATLTPNGQACVEIVDHDENTDALVAETLTVVLTSSSGDVEGVILTETGVDTGIFRLCLPTNVSGGGTPNDGTVNAPMGATLKATYVDPTDPNDVAEAALVVASPTAAITVSTQRTEPTDGTAVVGQFVAFEVVVTNSGNTTITAATVTDTFNDAWFSYNANSSPAPDTIAAGSLTWTDLGPLVPGDSASATIYLDTLAPAAPGVNSVSVTATDAFGTVLTSGPSTAEVTVTQPEIQLTSTIVSPAVGSGRSKAIW